MKVENRFGFNRNGVDLMLLRRGYQGLFVPSHIFSRPWWDLTKSRMIHARLLHLACQARKRTVYHRQVLGDEAGAGDEQYC